MPGKAESSHPPVPPRPRRRARRGRRGLRWRRPSHDGRALEARAAGAPPPAPASAPGGPVLARPEPAAPRAGLRSLGASGRRPDRRPLEQPAARRRSAGPDRLALPTARRPASPPELPGPRRRLLHAGRQADRGDGGGRLRDQSRRRGDPSHRLPLRQRRTGRQRPRPALEPRRRRGAARAPARLGRHQELPRHPHPPAATSPRARVRQPGARLLARPAARVRQPERRRPAPRRSRPGDGDQRRLGGRHDALGPRRALLASSGSRLSVRYERGAARPLPDRRLRQPRGPGDIRPQRPRALALPSAVGRRCARPPLARPAAAERRHPRHRRLRRPRDRDQPAYQPHRLAVRPQGRARHGARLPEPAGRRRPRPAGLTHRPRTWDNLRAVTSAAVTYADEAPLLHRRRELLLGAALTALIAALVLLVGPAPGDAPVHLYRTFLVRDNTLIWDNFWYAGTYPLASYSLLYYLPAALVGNLPLVFAAAVASTMLFSSLALREWGRAALWPSRVFGVLAAAPMFTGLYAYSLGFAAMLATLKLLQLRRLRLAVLAAALTVGFSPLAFAFLCLVVASCALARRRRIARRHLWFGLGLAAAAGIELLALVLFPASTGSYPFHWIDFAGVLLVTVLGVLVARRA